MGGFKMGKWKDDKWGGTENGRTFEIVAATNALENLRASSRVYADGEVHTPVRQVAQAISWSQRRTSFFAFMMRCSRSTLSGSSPTSRRSWSFRNASSSAWRSKPVTAYAPAGAVKDTGGGSFQEQPHVLNEGVRIRTWGCFFNGDKVHTDPIGYPEPWCATSRGFVPAAGGKRVPGVVRHGALLVRPFWPSSLYRRCGCVLSVS